MKNILVFVTISWLFVTSVSEPYAQQKKRRLPPQQRANTSQQRKDPTNNNPPATKPQVFTFDDTRLTVTRADVKDWQAREAKDARGTYVNELSEAKGSLVGLTLRFEAKNVIGVSYAIS